MRLTKCLPGRAWLVGTAVAAGLSIGATTTSAQETYVVGTGVPPFGLNDSTGQPAGFAVEVMKAIAADAGLSVEFRVYLVFGDIIPALLAGDIDIDATSTTITKPRIDMGLAFTGVYARWTEALVVPMSDTTPYRSLSEFAGKTVAAGVGTTYLAGLQARAGEFAGVTEIRGNDLGIEALRTGQAQAYVTNAALMAYEQGRGNYTDVRVVDTYEPIFPSAGGIAVRQDDIELLGLIQRSLSKLIADGSIAGLAEQWGVGAP